MTPSKATQAGHNGQAGQTPSAVFLCPLAPLKTRPDFLRANHGRRQVMPGFLLLARNREADEFAPTAIRVGYTCSKKLGNAVARNRAKRRLREVARKVLALEGRAGWDYVLIGRPKVTATRPFPMLLADLSTALGRIHNPKGKK